MKNEDENQIAKSILNEVVRPKNPAAVALGRLGASKGGKARAAKLTAKRRQQIARKAAKARWSKRKATKGLTVIELLVSVGVLVIILAIFSLVLHYSQQVVSVSQSNMRSNSTAAAITEIIRKDIRQASKNGYLCITQDMTGKPMLSFMSAGVSQSVITGQRGTGRTLAYGLCGNQADPNDSIFWRQGRVMIEDPNNTADPYTQDVTSVDWAEIQRLPRYDPAGDRAAGIWDLGMIAGSARFYAPADLRIPPKSLPEVRALWQVLSQGCTELSIMWADGTSTDANSLAWYGLVHDGMKAVVVPKDSDWAGKTIADGSTEYDAEPFPGAPDTYTALWSHHNQNNWPLAIKIRFTISDDALTEDFRGKVYEVICPVF